MLNEQLNGLRQYFDANEITLSERLQSLANLKAKIKFYESEILEALYQDLAKPQFESFASEIAPIYHEIDFYIKKLSKLMKPQRVATPISLFYSKSYILKVPLGCVLIIAPWNYPFNLAIAPLIGAIAAGNCVVVKPSEISRHVSLIIEKIITEVFVKEHVTIVQGDGAVIVPKLINSAIFNHVFFTGSIPIGREVARLCANLLIPYTLELGGKSPVIVDKSANLKIAAKRIIWGKFFNCGQTCISPDYALVDKSILDDFIIEIKYAIEDLKLSSNNNIAKIINQRQFERLVNYIDNSEVLIGGGYDRLSLRIQPTVIMETGIGSEIMQNEIFGPILPIISYTSISDVVSQIRKNRYPLAMYIFSNDGEVTNYLSKTIECGAVGVNSCLYHFVNSNLPFGGVMQSGFGQYHGKYSFDLFTHAKAVVKTSIFPDLSLRYPPYTDFKYKILRLISR